MLHIKPPMAQDADLFLAATSASQDYYKPWVAPPVTQEQFAEYLIKYNQHNNKSFLIIHNNALVGVVNLNEIVYGAFKSAYLGYYGVREFGRKGLMFAGMQLVIEYAFNHLGLHRLEANIQPENRRSINLVKKIGFSQEGFSPKYLYINGRWCDHERWALIALE